MEQSIRERLNLGKPNVEDHGGEHLVVTVADPHKVGEGISSYMVYKVITRYIYFLPQRGGIEATQ